MSVVLELFAMLEDVVKVATTVAKSMEQHERWERPKKRAKKKRSSKKLRKAKRKPRRQKMERSES